MDGGGKSAPTSLTWAVAPSLQLTKFAFGIPDKDPYEQAGQLVAKVSASKCLNLVNAEEAKL